MDMLETNVEGKYEGVIDRGWRQTVLTEEDEGENGVEDRMSGGMTKDTGVPRVRWFRAQWKGAPTVLTIRIDELRALKDKVLSGRYVMLVTLWDRLGGNV